MYQKLWEGGGFYIILFFKLINSQRIVKNGLKFLHYTVEFLSWGDIVTFLRQTLILKPISYINANKSTKLKLVLKNNGNALTYPPSLSAILLNVAIKCKANSIFCVVEG